MTHVRFVTAATVLSAFALFSIVVGAARVGTQNPGDAPPDAPASAAKDAEPAPAPNWGPVANGLRARVVPARPRG